MRKLHDITREDWLTNAIDQFRVIFKSVGDWDGSDQYGLPDEIHVSVGFPFGVQRENYKILGQCWARFTSDDGINHVFISPELSTAYDVLHVLAHELCHVWDDVRSGHRGEFVNIASAIGLMSPFRFTPASPAFEAQLHMMAETLGHYPHGALHPFSSPLPAVSTGEGVELSLTEHRPHSGPPRQTARQLKVQCPHVTKKTGRCGYIVRVSRVWLDRAGAPICPLHGKQMIRED